MIVYELICGRKHRFEGWFSSTEDFLRQRDATKIRCPICEDAAIERVPSAQVRVGHAAAPKEKPVQPAGQATEVVTGDPAALKLMRRLIANTENVGRAFAEEARKIHYEEVPQRGIRGQATPDEADELRDEGIDFLSLPQFLTRDLH
jgi:hypothetical protein